jgi:filamentous hemagglutinin
MVRRRDVTGDAVMENSKRAAMRKRVKAGYGTGARRRLDALARTTLALAVAIGLPTLARAKVQPTVHDGRQPTVLHAANGTPVVNIVAPGKHGISHNVYTQLDVGTEGLILNNSAAISSTQLAGYVYGNANLDASGSARIILNEVTSTRRSQLNGYMEVAGIPAEVIVANPNGITCNGCGFINTSRSVLTTGTPVFGGDGSLSAFRVTRGDIDIRGVGLDASHVDRVDLLARAVHLNASLWAQRLNIVTGANRIAHRDLAATPIVGEGDAPGIGIDVAALGGMYAGVIRLVGTEAGVGVNNEGEIAAQAGDFTLTSAGKVVLDGRTSAIGSVTVGAPQTVTVNGVLAAGDTLAVHGSDLDLGGTVYSEKAMHLDAARMLTNHGQVQASSGELEIHARGSLINAANASMYAGYGIRVDAGALGNAGTVGTSGDLRVTVREGVDNGGVLQADDGHLVLSAQSLDNAGTLAAGTQLGVTTSAALTSTGTITAGGKITLDGGDIVNAGVVQSAAELAMKARHGIQNSGTLYALGGDWAARAGGAFESGVDGDIYSDGDITLTAVDARNDGRLEAMRDLRLDIASTLDNRATLQSDGGDVVITATRVDNHGALSASGDIDAEVATTLDNSGTIVAAHGVSLSATGLTNAGQVQSGTDLTVHAAMLGNRGTLHAKRNAVIDGTELANATATARLLAGQTLTLDSTGRISNVGVLQAGGDLLLAHATALDNRSGALIYAGRDLDVGLGGMLANAGTMHAARTQTLAVASLDNSGTLSSAGDLQLDSVGDAMSSGAIEVQQSVAVRVGGDLTHAGKLYAMDGNLVLDVGGALAAQAGSDIYSGADMVVTAAQIAQAGMLEAGGDVAVGSDGAFDNSGVIQADGGKLGVTAQSIGNTGALSAAASAALDGVQLLDNRGTVTSGGAMTLDSGRLANRGGIQSGGNLTVQATHIDNRASIQSGQALYIAGNEDLANAQGSQWLAGGDLHLDSSGRVDNVGVVQAGGALSVTAAAIDNATTGVFYGARLARFDITGELDNAGTLYGSESLDLTAAVLRNDGVLRSGSALGIDIHGDAWNAGTAYAIGDAHWNIGGTLTNAGALASAADTSVHADALHGAGTLAAGLLDDGTLAEYGALDVAADHDLQAGGRNLAGGNLNLSGNTLDLDGAQTRGAGNVTLIARTGDIVHRGARLVAGGRATLTAAGALDNGGATAADGGSISATTLKLAVASIDNRHGKLLQSGADDLALRLEGAFDNAYGTLAVNAGNLDVEAASLDNSHGSIRHAGIGTLTLATSGAWDNRAGVVAGNGGLNADAGDIDNRAGDIGMLGEITLAATTLDNTDGSIAAAMLALDVVQGVANAGGTLQSATTLHLQAASLQNGDGQIKAIGSGTLDLGTTGALVNANNGFIGGNGAVTLEAGQLGNAGQIYAGSVLNGTVHGVLDNAGGALQALGALTLHSTGALDNHGGRIEAGAGDGNALLRIDAHSIDNRDGRLANGDSGDTDFDVDTAIDNRGGTLGGQGDVHLGTANLGNGDGGKLVAGNDLDLDLGRLDNAGGTVYAARNLRWSGDDAHLENASGSVGAGGNLSLGLGAVDNQGGDLAADGDVTLDLDSLAGNGRVVAGRDLSLTLSGDYTNGSGNTLKANRDVALHVDGSFTNPGGATLEAVRNLVVDANTIDNARAATINSADTALRASHGLVNAGRIEGDSVELTAAHIDNTGTVIGNAITMDADSLTNGTDLGNVTDNDAYQGALIAATDSIALYVHGTLLNRDATIFTTGDLTLAADAGLEHSVAIINRSGDIEADGNITLAANRFTNERRVFETQTYMLDVAEQLQNRHQQTIDRYRYDDADPVHRPPAVDAIQVVSAAEIAAADGYCTSHDSDHHRCIGYPYGYGSATTFHALEDDTVVSVERLSRTSAQSRLLAGGDIRITGSVRNDKSTIAAGRDLIVNGKQGASGDAVENIAWVPTATVQRSVTWQVGMESESHNDALCAPINGKSRCWVPDGYETYYPGAAAPDVTGSATVSLAAGTVPSWIQVAPGDDAPASMTAGQTVSITAHDIANASVDADGQPVHGAIGLGANGDGHSVTGASGSGTSPVTSDGGDTIQLALGDAPGAQHGDGGLEVAKGRSLSDGNAPQSLPPGDVSLAAPQSLAILTGPEAAIPLPASGLYTIDTSPQGSYLVETDPRFADYAQFISSDYLLDKLGYDPALIGKRLGDGFYEQRQVMDQITELTGRRFLSDDTDALAQYRELMDNSVAAVAAFDLNVGVALTAEQMADLTEDIVWLVSKTVEGQQVLVPVVYLTAQHARSLAAQGATIAGKNVVLDADGQLTNSGSIVASHSASLKAGNLLNSGAIAAGGDLSIRAAQDILNGGILDARGNVSLVAGNDVRSGVDAAVALGAVDLGVLGATPQAVALGSLPGSITAGGNLAIGAGRDLTLAAAPVSAGHDLDLAADRDMSLIAATLSAGGDARVLAGRDIDLDAVTHTVGLHGANYDRTDTTRTTVTRITAGGNLAVAAGRDLDSQGAQLEAGGVLAASAGRDMSLQAVTDVDSSLTHHAEGRTAVSESHRDETLRGTELSGGQGVVVTAGRDVAATAATFDGGDGTVTLGAGHDVILEAGTEHHSTARDTYHENHGLLSSSSTTTHDATQDGIAIGSSLGGDSVRIVAGHDLTTQGAQVSVAHDIVLAAGHDIDLGAAYDTHSEQHQRTTEKRGGGLGVLVGTSKSDLLTHRHRSQTDTSTDTRAYGTLLSGDTVSVVAGHDLTTDAAQIAATHDITLAAGHDLVIGAAANTHSEEHGLTTRVTGGQRNGLHAMVGVTKTGQLATESDTTYTGSLIGSTDGSVAMTAGQDVHIAGSDVLSQAGTAIVGQNVTIDAALGHVDSHQQQSMHTAGIMGGLSGGVVGVAESAYASAQRVGRAKDKRLKALYAAQAVYQGYSYYKDTNSNGVEKPSGGTTNGSNASGTSVNIAIGASTANSHADTHDDIAYGSHIRSQGDVTIVATNGDLDVIGSQISGDNVALAASHDLNLLSQAEQHTQKQSSANAGGQIGVSIGSTTGIYLSVEGGKGRAHGNGITHLDTTVGASDTLSLTGGNDATIRGAQVRGSTILADIGNDLSLASEQDTDDYASNYWQGGLTLVYGFSGGGMGVSGHLSLGQTDSAYASVTQLTGWGAGNGGYQIHVGGNTDLNGAVIASTADPALNYLSTGTLTVSDIQNGAAGHAFSGSFSADNSMFSGSKYAAAEGVARNVLGNSSDGEHRSSITLSDISDGVVKVRDGNAEAMGTLKRDAVDLSAEGSIRRVDTGKLRDDVEARQIIKGVVYQESLKFTDEAYRTMFLKKANFYEVVHDKDGKLIRGHQLTYEEKMNLKPAADGKIHIADNGIFNNEAAAEKYANQHSTAGDGPQYYIAFPEAENGISELLVAAYQEYLESDYWGLANATQETKDAMKQYGQQGLQIDAHSRGSLTVGNAMESLAKEGDAKGVLSSTTISFFGPAYNAKDADGVLAYLQNRSSISDPEQQRSMALTSQVHKADPVGRWIGGNPPTGGTIPEDSSWISEFLRALGGKYTAHNCYGTPISDSCKALWGGKRAISLPVQSNAKWEDK